MNSDELPNNQRTFWRLKRQTLYKRLEDLRNDIEITPETEINLNSLFFQLPTELRMSIYEYALSRSPVDHFKSLHHEFRANPASGLLLTCSQTRKEAWQIYQQDAIISLWPQRTHSNSTKNAKSISESWLQSSDGLTLSQNPCNVQQLALLIGLKQATRTMCEDFIEAEVLRKAHIRVKDIYIRLCICGALRWLHETPQELKSFCKALEMFASHFSTLERIHILYCGQKWPVWIQALGDVQFPEMTLAMQEVRAVSGGRWNIKRTCGDRKSSEPVTNRESARFLPEANFDPEVDEDLCRLRTTITLNSLDAQVAESDQRISRKERRVEINYYDSWTILKERCVRNKPPRPKDKSVTKSSKLTTPPTRLERNVTRIKDFVEGVPLVQTWAFYKYLPMTKDVGKEERGSHWRRY